MKASIKDIIKFSYKTDKVLFIFLILEQVIRTADIFINLYLVKLIINAFVKGKTKEEILFFCIIALISNFVLTLIKRFSEETENNRYRIVLYKRDMEINKKTMKLDYEFLEDSDLQLGLTKMREYDNFGNYGIYHVGRHFGTIINSVLTFVFAIVFSINLFTMQSELIPIANWLWNAIFILLFFSFSIISILASKKFNYKMQNMFDDDVVFLNRLFRKYIDISDDYKSGKDTRLYNYNLLNNVLKDSNFRLKKLYKKLSNNLFTCNVQTGLMTVFSSLLVYFYAGLKAYYGLIELGDIVQYTGIAALTADAITFMIMSISSLYANKDYFKAIFDYLNLSNTKYEGSLPIEKRDDNEYEFEFKNVSFKYPKSEKYVLQNVNLKFKIGQKLAIVGMNGSGKTTLIKLLTRFYDPSEGEILLNGINIQKYDYNEYLDIFSVVFQDFKLFSFMLGQNISAAMECDEKKAEEALNKAGFEKSLQKMPQGLKTYLYQDYEEGGIEISGGEAQKIAMARAIYKDSPFIILDEPTAALDPISEFEIYSSFDNIIGSKTAVYISHRLSSCKFCDEIAVFDEGKLVQHGSHDELLQEKCGKYFELWNAQAQYYREEEIEALLK
ncbi:MULTISPECIES: ABC transporter ATP-binding protein [unclassified Treponema]|uniref:ABC transporter ATP-binding protein n=1 Tax=unclassified Treponema TaxID=2638727 RepID=UPI0020A440DA|nr:MULTISPECIES: ABC transporter ATP-binding protein [unclassified Treponema]UTC67072.1 ABC transporter ATP-binding protein [Treponema sp. OMZ 789]UTC69803.1 ABC transporter ATP-binding protein [Treponema sp. OMZ 790]UTC72517.1 ABC transporter ATP-binding protein [Treponema sp. OMZ 791]